MDFQAFSNEVRFNDLCGSVQHCDLCSRLSSRVKVLSRVNGDISSKILFIAEAPGRLGADKTAIPLYGDKTGENFEKLISNIGWKREDFFITNAILCNPRADNGNNSTPTKQEVANCSFYLEMTINLIKPIIIVTLGLVALQALSLINKHNIVLKDDVATMQEWNGYKVFPLYHPGPRAALHRSLSNQRADFILLSKLANPTSGIQSRKHNRIDNLNKNEIENRLSQAILYIINFYKEISFFKLTKLLYLIDWTYIDKFGLSFTSSIYIRQEQGPWCPTLFKTVKGLDEFIMVKYKNKKPYIYSRESQANILLEDKEKAMLSNVIHKYKDTDDKDIKTRVYLTPPMKYILFEEKKGRDMRKIPVLYKDKTSIDLDRNSF